MVNIEEYLTSEGLVPIPFDQLLHLEGQIPPSIEEYASMTSAQFFAYLALPSKLGISIHDLLLTGQRQGKSWALGQLQTLISRGRVRVLDAGCASGLDTTFIGKHLRGVGGSVVGLDFVDGMIKQSKRRVARHALGNVSHVRGNFDNLPFRDSSFDYIVCSSSIYELDSSNPSDRHYAMCSRIDSFSSALKNNGALAVFNSIVAMDGSPMQVWGIISSSENIANAMAYSGLRPDVNYFDYANPLGLRGRFAMITGRKS
jgi:SAM-dependent methyltransferase